MLNDSEIINSWNINAKPWIKAIDNKEIESRKLITNKAIIDLIKSLKPTTLLDVGCGEGWLERELNQNISVYGIDVVHDLIKRARKANQGNYEVCAYEDLADFNFGKKFDCVVCNFSLIGKEATELVFKASQKILERGGNFIIQTLHPVVACGEYSYIDGWREGSWAGFSNEFSNPAPWYFRTLGGWVELFGANNLKLIKLIEPLHPKTHKPASIIFLANSI